MPRRLRVLPNFFLFSSLSLTRFCRSSFLLCDFYSLVLRYDLAGCLLKYLSFSTHRLSASAMQEQRLCDFFSTPESNLQSCCLGNIASVYVTLVSLLFPPGRFIFRSHKHQLDVIIILRCKHVELHSLFARIFFLSLWFLLCCSSFPVNGTCEKCESVFFASFYLIDWFVFT